MSEAKIIGFVMTCAEFDTKYGKYGQYKYKKYHKKYGYSYNRGYGSYHSYSDVKPTNIGEK